MSSAQLRVWFAEQLVGEAIVNNLCFGLRLAGELDTIAFDLSLRTLAQRHEALRSVFDVRDGEPMQIIRRLRPSVEIIEVTGASNRELELNAYARARYEVYKPFDLRTGPLVRLILLRLGREAHVLIGAFHHIIADNWSLGLFATELAKCYLAFHDGQNPELKPLRLQYADYADWQRMWIGSTECERQLAYWTSELAGAKFLLDLSVDGVRPTEQFFSGSSQARGIPEDRISYLRDIAVKYDATPFMVSLAVLQVLLWQYTGENDLLIGIPVAARNSAELEEVIGNFVNFVVVRGDLSGDPDVSDVICAVRTSMLDALANQDVPFERVVEALHPARSLAHHPIFQVSFTSIKAAAPCKSFGGLDARPYNIEASGTAFDLSMLSIEESPDTWWLRAEYRTQLFSNDQISNLLDHYIHLLGCIAARPTVRLSQLDLPSSWPAKRRNGQWRASDSSETVSAAAKTSWNGANTDPTERRSDVGDQSGDPVRETLTMLWAKVLGTDPPTTTSNFFELGGHSLMAARLASDIGRVYGTNFPVSLVFQAPTIEGMAQRVRGLVSSASSVVCIQENGALPPFFCGGSMRQLLDLSRGLGSDQPFFQLDAFALQQQKFCASEPLYASVPDLAACFRRDILSIQPAGPYFLGGMCDGGIIALEIALQLQDEGREVALLAEFDTPVNGYWRKSSIDLFRQGYDLIVSGRLPSSLHKRFYARKMRRLPVSEDEEITNLIWSAVRAYRPNRVFQGEIQIFRGPRPPIWFYEDVVRGWEARASKGIRVHKVLGHHGKLFGHPISQRIIANIIEQARHRSLAREIGAI